MRKIDELNYPYSCLNKADDEEHIFVLRAQDAFAPLLVQLWADFAALQGVDPAKVDEALRCKEHMLLWPTRRVPT